MIGNRFVQRVMGAFNYYPWTPYKASLSLRSLRAVCAAANHHPREPNASWVWGYGYFCERCCMPADPWTIGQHKAASVQVALDPSQPYVARVVRDIANR